MEVTVNENQKASILVVDDEPNNLALLERVLHRDYQVDTAASGEEALDLLEKKTYAVVLSDEKMPGMSGVQFLAQVLRRAPNTVRMIVTGYSDLQSTTDAINVAGISGYVTKPFTTEQLLGAIAKAVQLSDLVVRNSELVSQLNEANRLLEMNLADLKREVQMAHAHIMLTDRMASLGILAAGVSHEINNPLTFVMANLSFITAELEAVGQGVKKPCSSCGVADDERRIQLLKNLDEVQAVLNEVHEGTGRIKNIVRDLKTFARPSSKDDSIVELRPIIESTINMAWNEIRHRSRLIKDFADVPSVKASETKLAQVFLNLLINAAHAIPEGFAQENTIRITTSAESGDRVVVEVRDSGKGIEPENLDRIFVPFFSTKQVGEGTGLGLAICHGIVTSLGGEITAESTVGQGSCFRVVLPAASADVPQETKAPLASVAHEPQRFRILIVDDEVGITRALRRLFSTDHDVVAATSGDEALRLLSADEEPFDVVVCDLLMPNVTGMDVFDKVTRNDPAMTNRFVFMTGSAFTARARGFVERVTNICLRKPFDLDEVRRTVLHMAAMQHLHKTVSAKR
ncbi:MAG: hypothetical protein A2341_21330 [Deltaproteobacteria bacterium RIFOXYB12_FULL_58_9]|nr:MAG: hypothetical protein A2341_21330 [Deltaproteobacteria bacterium RIFOXYB12_FULL_58_9]